MNCRQKEVGQTEKLGIAIFLNIKLVHCEQNIQIASLISGSVSSIKNEQQFYQNQTHPPPFLIPSTIIQAMEYFK